MKTPMIFLIAVLVLLAGALVFSAIQIIQASQPKEIPSEYSYTKAICDENNVCQDHIVVCQGSQIVSTTPITGAVVQKSQNWKDPRDPRIINEFCNLTE